MTVTTPPTAPDAPAFAERKAARLRLAQRWAALDPNFIGRSLHRYLTRGTGHDPAESWRALDYVVTAITARGWGIATDWPRRDPMPASRSVTITTHKSSYRCADAHLPLELLLVSAALDALEAELQP